MYVKSSGTIDREQVPAGTDTTKQVLIGKEEGPNFAMRRFEIQPGGGMPLHTNVVEHEQYVLGGQAHIRIGAQEYTVREGDAVFIPAGIEHSYDTVGDEPFAFICVVPNQEDMIELVG